MAIYNSKWTGIEIDERLEQVGKFSNRNLLDNWYFGNPVNQRGQTEYSGYTYTIDRWRLSYGDSAEPVKIEDGFLTLSSAGATQETSLDQYFEFPSKYYNVKVTGSVLFNDGTLVQGTGIIPEMKAGSYPTTTLFSDADTQILVQTGSTGNSLFRIVARVGKTIRPVASKVELGEIQTLAHQENGVWVLNEIPNYAEELAKCQRYALCIKTRKGSNHAYIGTGVCNQGTTSRIFVPTPVTMRPVMPSIAFNGTFVVSNGKTVVSATGFSVEYLSPNGVSVLVTTGSGLTTGDPVMLRIDNDATSRFILSADL